LYHSPANVFVADFVGELPTNFFAAQWRWRTGELRSTRSELIFQAGEAAGAGLGLVGQRQHAFTVAIRPQHLFLRPAGGSRMSAIAGEVIGNEYLGAQTILTVRNGGDEFRVSTHPHIAPLCGDRITLYYRPRDVMVFDRTGAALTH
jgi:ABC-type sugar transport system ATPase subunit